MVIAIPPQTALGPLQNKIRETTAIIESATHMNQFEYNIKAAQSLQDHVGLLPCSKSDEAY